VILWRVLTERNTPCFRQRFRTEASRLSGRIIRALPGQEQRLANREGPVPAGSYFAEINERVDAFDTSSLRRQLRVYLNLGRYLVAQLEHVDPAEEAALQQTALERRLRVASQQCPEGAALQQQHHRGVAGRPSGSPIRQRPESGHRAS
jgi:hypothetical protein